MFTCAAICIAIAYGTSSHRNNREKESQALYEQYCGNCHGPKGEGLRQLYPPLTDPAWLDVSVATCIIHYGIQGEITVNGQTFTGTMPPQVEIRPDEIAAILSYIRQEFLNEKQKVTIREVNEAIQNCRDQHNKQIGKNGPERN